MKSKRSPPKSVSMLRQAEGEELDADGIKLIEEIPGLQEFQEGSRVTLMSFRPKYYRVPSRVTTKKMNGNIL